VKSSVIAQAGHTVTISLCGPSGNPYVEVYQEKGYLPDGPGKNDHPVPATSLDAPSRFQRLHRDAPF
jgi:hypothetical protein